jgi:hypothetical protein
VYIRVLLRLQEVQTIDKTCNQFIVIPNSRLITVVGLMCNTCGITNATGVHGHINNLLLDRRRLTGVGIVEEKGTPTPLEARPAPIALLPFRRQPMLNHIDPLALGAVQPLNDHCFPHAH